jgi:hypothetical protein
MQKFLLPFPSSFLPSFIKSKEVLFKLPSLLASFREL